MATWHQQQNPVQLWHETKWSVVEDAGHTSVSRFDTAEEAETFNNRIHRKGSYILPPMQHQMAKGTRRGS